MLFSLGILLIIGPPSITTRHETDIHHKRLRLIGHVSVFNDSPDIQQVFWTKNGEKIDSQGSGGRLSKETINDPSLTINEVCNLDAGHYKLTAVNAVGSNCDEIILGINTTCSTLLRTK